MKRLFLILLLALPVCARAQENTFSVDADYLTRGEIRNGGIYVPKDVDEEPSIINARVILGSNTMKKLTCALVGFGGIGHHHASRYAHCKNVRLVAICDIDPARLAEAESETNLGGSGALDLSNLSLALADATALDETKVYTIATATSVTGRFANENLPKKWRATVHPTHVTLAYANGTVFLFR